MLSRYPQTSQLLHNKTKNLCEYALGGIRSHEADLYLYQARGYNQGCVRSKIRTAVRIFYF